MPISHMIGRVVAAAIAVSCLAPAVRAQSSTTLQLCGVENDVLKSVVATYRPATRDTLVDGQRFSTRFRFRYAATEDWYKDSFSNILEKDYLKYGLPRRLAPSDLRLFVYYRGVPVFLARSDADRKAEIVYVFSGPGCEFQPYQVAPAAELHESVLKAFEAGRHESALAGLGLKSLWTYGPTLVFRGHLFAGGEAGVRRDTAFARKLFQQGIEARDPDGWAGLARLAEAAGDERAAVTLYQASADQGSGAGAAAMAGRHVTGRGVAASPEEAAYYLRIALDRLHERSALRDSMRAVLADLYAAGRGVRRDAGAHYVRDLAAARNGDPLAQYLMGRRYETAMAVIHNRDEAVRYYRQAADQRHAPSMRALDRLGIRYVR